MLRELMRKIRLITRNDLIIDWRIFYNWAQLIYDNHDKTHGLVILPKDINMSLFACVRLCTSYFSAQTTQEILDELRPRICPFDSSFVNTIKMFTLLLPVNLPPDLHNQGFKLWLAEFFGIWANIQKTSAWKSYLCVLFSSVAWNNIGHIHWEPWMPQIFTHILRSFSLPIGKIQISLEEYNPIVSTSTKWIIAMIGNGGSCLQYLRDLLMAMKSFYHPSNTGAFQKDLVEFILGLAQNFVDRVHLERTSRPVWSFAPLESYRLTEQDITDFVNCVKDYAFISIFNKDYTEEAAKTCKYLSILRPELIIPSIVEKHFSSIDCMTEPHRFTSIITCLTHIARQIVQQTSAYSQGQIYVLPILMSVLPGIDLNDLEKTSVTLEFLDTILMLITCVDCSSAVNTRNDLTEIEKEVCLSTASFEDFIVEFLNRIFQMIDVLSADMSDAVTNNADIDIDDIMINWKLTTIMFNIVQQCSSKIFQKIREKVINFVSGVCLSSRVRDIVSSLVQALVKGNPVETLKYLMPKTCESIEKILNNSESTILLTDHKGDIELTWYLILFAELVHARGDALMIYKSMIMSVFRQCIYFINKNSYETIAHAIEHLLESLTHVYPIDYRLTVENIDEPFVDFLPIRAWGQYVDFNKLQVQFHIPNEDEIDFACEFVNTFLYPELTLLNEKGLKISNDERLRSLTIIQSIATECFRMIPRIESEQIQNLIPSVVPYESKYQIQFPIYSKEPSKKKHSYSLSLDYLSVSEFKENLRMRLFIDIGKLLDLLIENNSDDVASMTTALKFYSLTSIYYGINESYIEFSRDEFTSHEQLLKNKLCGEGQNNRFLSIQKIGLQIEELELSNVGILNDIDKQIILKLFELSINRYSEVRCAAQTELFKVLKYYQFSFQVIIDRIAELFNTQDEVDHDQIKGCLYILLGDDSFFLPTKYSWTMKEKLWPSIVRMAHANKISIQNLIDDIHEKICDEFVTQVIIQNTNEISIHAAIGLWHPLEPSEIETRNESNQTDIQSYSNLIEALNLSLVDDILTWGQQKIAIGLLCLLLQKFVPISSSCIETFVDFLVHDNIELRRYATIGIVAFCRLQKPPRIYIEKSLEEIFHNISKSLPAIMNDECSPGDRDDNSWVTIDDYKPPETQIEWEQTCFLDKPFHEKKEKQASSHRVAAEIVAGMICGSKYWTLEMLNELWEKLTPFLTEVCTNLNFETFSYWNTCFKYSMENKDPRRIYRLIHFICTLINTKTMLNTFNEMSRWTLIENLREFQWRIPSVWCKINDYAKTLLDHPYKDVRESIANILSISISFDITLFNGKSTRQPNTSQFIDTICKQLQQAIEIHERTSLINISDEVVGIDLEARKALNFIEAVVDMHMQFFFWCQQPVKNAIIRLFPYLCEIESIATNDNVFREKLTISRLYVGMCFLNANFLEVLIQQLEQVCTSPKWHARRATIEFAQNMIFCNLFNARPYSKQLHKLVLKCLFDEQFEVRIAALMTLSGFYQCDYIQVTNEDLKYFRMMSKTNYFTETDGKKVTLSNNIAKRHGGILGLCAIVLSSPYDIPTYVPDALMLLCEHSHDPDIIQKSIKNCLSEFRRTHHDSWHEHREQFTEDQLAVLADVLISHSYYA
ncbi:unnamed protein product [Rotaria sordida]|uniref:Proteasome activator complex subunit 4 n=1 Tax=Rotaria sordida TaxID=392033 RepID=A0A814RJP5_9BILA|nr:unnamed protein product [Rotaria sordida]